MTKATITIPTIHHILNHFYNPLPESSQRILNSAIGLSFLQLTPIGETKQAHLARTLPFMSNKTPSLIPPMGRVRYLYEKVRVQYSTCSSDRVIYFSIFFIKPSDVNSYTQRVVDSSSTFLFKTPKKPNIANSPS